MGPMHLIKKSGIVVDGDGEWGVVVLRARKKQVKQRRKAYDLCKLHEDDRSES
jgi:hypothetical protein